MSTEPSAQGHLTDYALHTLGWKSFQDLCVAVSAEVLNRPVEVFLPSRDGGRDGAFIGKWESNNESIGLKSTIQCKFTSKSDSNLSLSDIKLELKKVPALVKQCLAEEYILITNFGVSGESDAKIVKAFKDAGVKHCRIFGRDWLTSEIKSRPKLRMMVPRLYGLGDLSQIIDERAYLQARQILSSMGDDLACFVTTEAHRRSVHAINRHNFVLLLGDPASGKSTIGASLAIGSLDDGAIGTVKINSPEQFDQHWNPNDPKQFFWIDDAFGATQYQRFLVDGWNARLRSLRAAIKAGGRVLMTSRTYIWNAASRDLKTSDFPLMKDSQVIIDVQGLRQTEKAQILYNHIKLGNQDSDIKSKLKPYLPSVAENLAFLPETARRLGSKFFTQKLSLTELSIQSFVESPVEFLVEVLKGLDEGAEAAVALIFLHGRNGLPSPVISTPSLDLVLRLTGSTAATVTRSLEALRGSLTLLVEEETESKWFFKHPTIADAYAKLLGESPERIELYVRGAKLERMLGEIVCKTTWFQGAHVKVPAQLYEALYCRLREVHSLDRSIINFLAYRADCKFLSLFFSRCNIFEGLIKAIHSEMRYSVEVSLLSRLHSFELLPETFRLQTVRRINELTIENADGSVFTNDDVRRLFDEGEFNAAVQRFQQVLVKRYEADPLEWGNGVWSSDMAGYFRSYKEALESYRDFRSARKKGALKLQRMIDVLDVHILNLEETDESEHRSDLTVDKKSKAKSPISLIFEDVDQ